MSYGDIFIRAVPDRGAIVNGLWHLLTSIAWDELRSIRRSPNVLAQARMRRERD